MLEQAKSCHRAEGSFLPAAESPWAHGLKGFFNYRRGTRRTHVNSDMLEVGFPKCCFPHFIARESWNRVLGQAWCGAEKAAVKGSSFGKTQQCMKINRRVLIITTSAVAIFHGQCFDLLSVTNKRT